MIGKQFSQWQFWEISPTQIKENQRQSQIIAGERLPSLPWLNIENNFDNIYYKKKIVQTLLIAFWWLLVTLKSENVQIFKKNITLTRAPTLSKNRSLLKSGRPKFKESFAADRFDLTFSEFCLEWKDRKPNRLYVENYPWRFHRKILD